MHLSLVFEESSSGHDQIVLQFAGQTWSSSAYYYGLDRGLLPERHDGSKVRVVLHRLLEQWLAAVENLSDGSTAYLPYDFSDQYTVWLRCIRSADKVDVCRGWTQIVEGWSIYPSQVGDHMISLPGFQPDGPTVQMPMSELIGAIQRLVHGNA